MKRIAVLATMMAALCVLAVGCGVPKGARVTAVVTTPPLKIGTEGSLTQVSTESMTPVQNRRLDPVTGKLVTTDDSSDVVLTRSIQNIEVPQEIKGLEAPAVEAITFNASLARQVSVARAAGDSVIIALTINMTDPPADLAPYLPITVVKTIVEGPNTWTITAEERQLLSRLIQEADKINLELYVDGSIEGYTFDNMRLVASGSVVQQFGQ